MTSELAVASTSPLAAAAGAFVAGQGGNAVDAAIAAAMVSINTEPGVCSLGCGGYITVWPPGERPVTLDGYVAAPGRGPVPAGGRRNAVTVHLEYGGGITTVVGPDSVGVPGGVAVMGHASSRFGKLPWAVLLEPAIDATRRGFPLPTASYNYLVFSGDPIFGRSADGRTALRDDRGELRRPGERVRVPHLDDTLEQLAQDGAAAFYTGEIGHAMADFVQSNGGRLSRDDLAGYDVIERPSLTIRTGDWEIATNPPPAVGGAVLASMLHMMSRQPVRAWDRESLDLLVRVQHAALGYRRARLDLAADMDAEARRLLELAATGDPARVLEAGSTSHTSAVDANGLVCAVTMSAGYGAGDMPPDTGIWLNNFILL